ncbi:MAG: monofunctional biosynthetic peptidoglycan transglycosylase [Gammaproteobacteria bacterium]|jgi:monofunctional biosynthetic peptidoglycan transglycosylase|nr:monofunctional biosynthetic peptidoglycan transglycosylase [Gammaproteobacteria bacterium]
MKCLHRWLLRIVILFLMVSLVPVMLLRWVPPPTSAVMVSRTLAERERQDYQWIPLERMSPDIPLAVVASEDQKFPDHFGFDLDAIKDAVAQHTQGGRLRGASTLTQQVARNLFLWQGRSFLRKGLEAWLTLLLELCWSKERILEVYLNIAETGKRTFGVQAASLKFFSRPASAVSREQAALLAAVLPNPLRFQAARPSAYVIGRRNEILRQMTQLGGRAYLKGILPTAYLQ